MIEVVGIGDDGWSSLPADEQELVRRAPALVGGERHLELVPAVEGQRRLTWPKPFRDGVRELVENHPGLVVLASGDPLRSGVGSTLVEMFGVDAVRIRPHLSSDALARARMGWAAESVDVVTLVGRPVERLRAAVWPGARIVVLCSDGSTPAVIAESLVEWGSGDAVMTAWWHLGGSGEGSRRAVASQWGAEPTPDLVVVCVDVVSGQWTGGVAGRPEDAFDHDGLITKRDLRAGALARLRPAPGEVLWDLGAGSGAVGIEWVLGAPGARSVAVERDATRAAQVRSNAARWGVGERVDVVEADVDEYLASAASGPDAVFLGGGLSASAVERAVALARRVVAHAVTMESERLLLDAQAEHGGELVRVSVETMRPLGRFRGWNPARAIVQWSWEKQ